jgi:valyl-tRNA synthetase
MKGHPVIWIPGLDHAGIATQAIMERMLQRTRNVTRHDLGRTEFMRLLWQWKAEKAPIIKQQLKALGATLDWDREYFTIDEVTIYLTVLYIIILYYIVAI